MNVEFRKEAVCILASYLIAVAAALLVFPLRLLPCLLAGMVTFEIIDAFRVRSQGYLRSKVSGWLAVMFISLLLIATVFGIFMLVYNVFTLDFTSEGDFYRKLNDVVREAHDKLYPVLGDYMPRTYQDIETAGFTWLQTHIYILQNAGQKALHFFAVTFVGIFLAILISLASGGETRPAPYLKYHLLQRIRTFREVFSAVVTAQVKVAAFNALATGVFLYLVMPLLGYHLPYAKTLTFVTFLCSLLPIVGNLISNTLVTLVALSVSLQAAVVVIFYLILIHKAEYFINARIFGSQIQSSVWELLLAMLIFESLFGIAGVVAAPIFYAWLKVELMRRHLI
ncbi:AI-2E family transporter [Dryocola sp. BD613]|uniref:AI-2E family transporter n=1 Tax=Dryocola sp. BD613 TaxID=3133272 RepID=UPI003F50717F